jgi:plastocyanin
MSKNLVIAAIIIIVILAAGFFALKAMNPSNQAQNTSPAETTTEATTSPLQEATGSTEESSPAAMSSEEYTFTLSSSGVDPKSITIKAGETVTWVNNTGETVQINSAPHPVHTDYPPLNTVGQIPDGGKKSLSFPTPGTYKWHNHLNPSVNGSITVQ